MQKLLFSKARINKDTTETDIYKDELYIIAKRYFANADFVSTGMLQRYLQVPYNIACYILDQMIVEQYCGSQYGAEPCKIIKIDRIN